MASKSGGTFYRDAKTGRLVTAEYAKRNPNTTISERVGGGSTGRSRSAVSGRFVVGKYMRINPRTTVTES